LEQAKELFRGITMLEESTTYQYILKKGALGDLRKALLRLGHVKFRAEPGAAIAARISAVAEPDELHRLLERVLFVNTWQDLFDAP
jgi:hypothetical protein